MPWIPHTADDTEAMCRAIGVASVEDLFSPVPRALAGSAIDLPPALDEQAAFRHLRTLSEQNNIPALSFVGGGFYEHFIPAAVDSIAGKREFATAYTPYQAEASQGMLQAIYEYQTHITRLTGLDVANASLYDGATAAAEAMLMAMRATRRHRVAVSATLQPAVREVLETVAAGMGAEVVRVPHFGGATDSEGLRSLLNRETACLIVQQPNYFGCLEAMPKLGEAARESGAIFIAIVNPLSLGLLAPPGEYGADIAAGSGQPLGIPLSYGGPGVGFLACTEKLMRQIPGRLAGKTVDTEGRRGFILTLQAREQHIRREKATSNICTNQALCALRVAVYLSLIGKEGFRETAEDNYRRAHYLAERLRALDGVELAYDRHFWNEFTVALPVDAADFRRRMRMRGIDPGLPLAPHFPGMDNYLLLAVTETKTREDLDALAEAFAEEVAP